MSTTKELKAVENRVRNLIGDSNWGDEGRYKEAILRNMIKKFISPKYTVGTGFIVKSMNEEIESSTQIDILIFDSDYPILFSEGDFYIVTPNSVKAVIEVKTEIKGKDLEKAVKKLNDIGLFLEGNTVNIKPFIGLFSFEWKYKIKSRLKNRIKPNIQKGIGNKCFVNHVSLNKDIFIKYWPHENSFSAYLLEDLSFAYFISNLINSVTERYIENESNMWYPTNKEREKLFDIQIY